MESWVKINKHWEDLNLQEHKAKFAATGQIHRKRLGGFMHQDETFTDLQYWTHTTDTLQPRLQVPKKCLMTEGYRSCSSEIIEFCTCTMWKRCQLFPPYRTSWLYHKTTLPPQLWTAFPACGPSPDHFFSVHDHCDDHLYLTWLPNLSKAPA